MRIGILDILLLNFFILLLLTIIAAGAVALRMQLRRQRQKWDTTLGQIIPERIRLLNRLAELYADLDESDNGLLSRKDRDRGQVILSFKEELDRLQKDEMLWESLETVLDREKDGVATLLKSGILHLDRQDYRLMLLLYAGVKAETAGIICRLPAGTVRQRKSRFLKRVRKAALPEADRTVLLEQMP